MTKITGIVQLNIILAVITLLAIEGTYLKTKTNFKDEHVYWLHIGIEMRSRPECFGRIACLIIWVD